MNRDPLQTTTNSPGWRTAFHRRKKMKIVLGREKNSGVSIFEPVLVGEGNGLKHVKNDLTYQVTYLLLSLLSNAKITAIFCC
jgi:hypothetical protein